MIVFKDGEVATRLVGARPRRGSSPSSSRGSYRLSLVRYYAASTLDGYIAEADDSIDWLTGYEGSFEGADSDGARRGYDDFYEGIGALVMGSVTYEWVLAHAHAAGPTPASRPGC